MSDIRTMMEDEASIDTCGALKDYYYVACLSTELTTKSPIARRILDVPLALFRDHDGKACCVIDRCLHRGAALSRGVVIDGKLCCPYHGYSYNGEGRCVEIPSMQHIKSDLSVSVAQALPQAVQQKNRLHMAPDTLPCLQNFHTLEQDGLVYVCLSDDISKVRAPPFRVPFVDDKDWSVYFMVTPFENGVTNLVENFMDVPHTVFVHRGWFRNKTKKKVPATVKRSDNSVLVTYKQEADAISGLGVLLNPSRKPMVHTDCFIAPNITRVDYHFGDTSGFVINSQCTPITAFSSMVYTAISYRLPFGHMVSEALVPLIRWYTRQVILQDTDIMQTQKLGLTSTKQPVRFHSTEADLLHQYIEDYRAWLRTGGSASECPSDEEHPIAFYV